MIKIIPTLKTVGQMQSRSIEELKNEPMFWMADYQFAKKQGGDITKEFLKFLDPTKNWLIDSRVHMLMEGWYPCIGGWHLDHVPRDEKTGQPNYKNPAYVSQNIVCVVDINTESLTEFLMAPVVLPEPSANEKVYGAWSKVINEMLENKTTTSAKIKSGEVISFDAFSLHRGVPAQRMGWRMFLRGSTDIPSTPKNEIRKQVNTYISIEAGW